MAHAAPDSLEKGIEGKTVPKERVVEAPKEEISPEQMWADVAGAGLAFLDKLGNILLAGKRRPMEKDSQIECRPEIASTFIEQDNAGRSYLKLPLPQTETLRKVADLLYKLTGGKGGPASADDNQ